MNIKKAHLIILLVLPMTLLAQSRYVTKTGEINFEASVPSFEEVKAKNANVSAILKGDTGEFASLALVSAFRFKVALMEEHFNENYIESSKYPRATFKGKIIDFNLSNLSETSQKKIISGSITMHGETKLIEVPVSLSMVDNNISMELHFVLKPADFNIKIPKIVSSKIADQVDVSAVYLLKK